MDAADGHLFFLPPINKKKEKERKKKTKKMGSCVQYGPDETR